MSSTTGLEIAVIGMAGRFPGAENVDALWSLVASAQEGISQFTLDELVEAGVSPETAGAPNYVARRGVVARKKTFDAELFGYSAREAASMDPQLAVFHEAVWEALEHAGYDSEKFAGMIGLYAGAASSVGWMHHVSKTGSLADEFSTSSVADTAYLCTRVAYKLNLSGPALSTQTACSTSLVNIHLACMGLIIGECDIAVAGGVSIPSPENIGYLFQQDMILSPDGACRSFDADAAGTVPGEGCGLLVLKRLDQAIADNDCIHAVIKGSAINNDGRRKVGFTAPSVEGQAAVIRNALARAEVPPASIGYIEAHGTATRLGDSIEIAALKRVFAAEHAASCAIGSIKPNIGHAGEAAGVAGAIKTIMALRHRLIPPTLHYKRSNPLLELEGSPFQVASQLASWPAHPNHPRRAGVSSFGIGGTNAHVVFEEHIAAQESGPSRALHLVSLSAHTATALQAIEANLLAYLDEHPEAELADLCYTLHLGRKDLAHRKALAVADRESLLAVLQAGGPAIEGKAPPQEYKLCFMFPGQGTQYVQMGRDLYQQEPVFRQHMDRCFAIAEAISPANLRGALFPAQHAGDAADLSRTDVAQPVLFMFEYALARTLMHWGCQPDAYLGHSLGEYVAACLAGVFSLDDAIALVIRRGQLVQGLPPGAMLAASMSAEAALALAGDEVDLAAINGASRVVLAGSLQALASLKRQLDAAGVQSTMLPASHAFHSRHLDPVLEAFRGSVRALSLHAPNIPFLSNVTGTWITGAEAMSPDYWVDHLRHTVRFADGVATVCASGEYLFVEAGPGNTLGTLVRQAAGAVSGGRCVQLAPTAQRNTAGAGLKTLLEGLCRLYVHGMQFDWQQFYAGQRRARLALPTYPFEGRNHYRAAARASAGAAAIAPAVEAATDVRQPDASGPAGHAQVLATLADIWKNGLEVDEIGVHDDLFGLGIDSLLSIRVITEIRERFKAEIALNTILELRTIAEQADEIDKVLGQGAPLRLGTIVPRTSGKLVPLSSSQKRLWIVSQLESEHSAYNTGACFFMKALDVDVLERALKTIIERHSILRTVYREIDGVPYQEVRDAPAFRVRQIDLSGVDLARQRIDVAELWRKALLAPIDLRKDVMLRAYAVKLSQDTHFVAISQHHICSDNWSTNLLNDELHALYDAYMQGKSNPLPPLPIQYSDYVLWQNEAMAGGALDDSVAYWKRALEGITQVHNLPLDRPRPKYQSYLGTQYFTRIDQDTLHGLDTLAQENNATLFMVMQAAFAALVGRFSGEDDVVVGFPVANRMHKEVEPLIGFFVNTLVLRSNLAGDPSFVDFLQQARRNLLDAYAHAGVPFEVLVNELNPERSLSYESIAQIQIVFLDQSKKLGGRGGEPADGDAPSDWGDLPIPFSKYDLTLYFSIADSGLSLAWEYSSGLFDASTIHRLAGCFETLLRAIVGSPRQPVKSLPLLSAAEMSMQFSSQARQPQALSARLAETLGTAARPQAGQPAGGPLDFSLFFFANDAGDRTTGKYELLLEAAKFADRHGFAAIWTPERHFGSFGGIYPNPAITTAALASVTKNLKIRAGSCVLPLHHPVRVAEDWSVIDNISGGRVGIGFAAGYSPVDFVLAPEKYAERRAILDRDIKTVKALWRGESVTLPNGVGGTSEVSIWPRPVQPELPVWVTTTGNIDAFRHAGRAGDNLITHLIGQTVEALTEKIDAYREQWRHAGHPGKGAVTVLVHTFVTDREEVVFEHAKEPFKKYLVNSAGTPQGPQAAAAVNDEPVTGKAAQADRDADAISEFAFKRYYETSALLGTPERCLALVQRLRGAGVDEIACLVDFGVDQQLVLDNLRHLDRLRAMTEAAIRPLAGQHPGEPVAQQRAPDTASAAGPAPHGGLHQLFERQAARLPEAIAVEFEGSTLTYAELNKRANQLAHFLIARNGVQSDRLVGICMAPGLSMIVAILGVLKAGAAYVPIEPALPAARVAAMVGDSGIDLVLVEDENQPCLANIDAELACVDAAASANDAGTDPGLPIASSSLAYVMYTSGSTGTPKGVMVEHRQVRRLMSVTQPLFGFGDRDVWVLFHSFAFDVSVWEMWGALAHGGRLLVVPKELIHDSVRFHRLLVEREVTVLNQTPSAFYTLQSVIPREGHGLKLRYVNFAGEALQPNRLLGWFQPQGDSGSRPRFINMYGATEAAVHCTFKEILLDDAQVGSASVGRCFDDMSAAVLSPAGLLQPIGVAGELYLSGEGLARGYLNQPELTARKFVSGVLPGMEERRWYRTGDLVRWLPSGELEYLARIDNQVKVRGYRIELGEIESLLLSHPAVKEAAVLALGEGENRYLAACIVPAATGQPVEASLVTQLKQALTDALPHYMVPQVYSFVSKLPLNQNGKLDRALIAKTTVGRAVAAYIAPRTAIETELARMWCRLLEIDQISVDANFFELGGQSLVAIRVANEISGKFGVNLESRIIFEYNTVELLASHVAIKVWHRSNQSTTEKTVSDDEEEFTV